MKVGFKQLSARYCLIYRRLCIRCTDVAEDSTVDSTIEELLRSSCYVVDLDPCSNGYQPDVDWMD